MQTHPGRMSQSSVICSYIRLAHQQIHSGAWPRCSLSFHRRQYKTSDQGSHTSTVFREVARQFWRYLAVRMILIEQQAGVFVEREQAKLQSSRLHFDVSQTKILRLLQCQRPPPRPQQRRLRGQEMRWAYALLPECVQPRVTVANSDDI